MNLKLEIEQELGMKLEQDPSLDSEPESNEESNSTLINKIGLVRDKLSVLKAELEKFESDGNDENSRRRSVKRLGQAVSHTIETYMDKEGKNIESFLHKVELLQADIEAFENGAQMLNHYNNSIYESLQPDPKMMEDQEELHNDLANKIPLILMELEKICLRNEQLEETHKDSAYLRIRRSQYSLLSQRASKAIMSYFQNQITYQEKCDLRANHQFKLVSSLTNLHSDHVFRLLYVHDPNNMEEITRRAKVTGNKLAKQAFADLEHLRKESNRIHISNQNLSEPIFETMNLLSMEYQNNATNSLQYQQEHVIDFHSDEEKVNESSSRYFNKFKTFFATRKNSIICFLLLCMLIEVFMILFDSDF